MVRCGIVKRMTTQGKTVVDIAARNDHRNSVLRVIGGAVCTSVSAGFVKLSGASAGTAAFLRCAIALVVLVPLTLVEWRRIGPRPWRLQRLDVAAGALLGVDYVCWVKSIYDVGASIATVLINIQVVVFPLLAWVFLRTRSSGRFLVAVPVMLFGVVLAAGLVGPGEPGTDPVGGIVYGAIAGITYAGYMLFMRLGGGHGHVFFPVCASTATACLVSALIGGLWTGLDLSLTLPGWLWLTALALIGQVLGWLLIAGALPRLAPHISGTLLLLHPVLAVFFGVIVLGERPTAVQIGGCLLVIAGVWFASRVPRRHTGEQPA